MHALTIKRSTADHPDFRKLVNALDQELYERYTTTQANFDAFNMIDDTMRVVLSYDGNIPIACGVFRPTEKALTVEIKRMYVKKSWRGRGIAKLVLQHLELWAKEEGFQYAILETGIKQPEAIQTYTQTGYTIIPNFGPYQDNPESVCMQKQLMK